MRARAVVVRAALVVLAAVAAAWAAGNYLAVFVGGGSMEPTLVTGDLAIVRRGSCAAREGDVVLVAKPGWPRGVLHRIDAVMSDGTLRLKGDANRVPDRDLLPDWRVRGVVTLVVPSGRALTGLRRLLRLWYNPASQQKRAGVDGEARACGLASPGPERDPARLKGSRGRRACARFTPRAAPLRGATRAA